MSTTRAFAYDSIGRLITVTRDGAAEASYEYDANGNRLRAVTPGGVLAGSYDAQDRLTSYGDATYSYNQAGELERKALEAAPRRVGTQAVRLRVRYPYEHTAAIMRALEQSAVREVEHGYAEGAGKGRSNFLFLRRTSPGCTTCCGMALRAA